LYSEHKADIQKSDSPQNAGAVGDKPQAKTSNSSEEAETPKVSFKLQKEERS
jgi:hypothetical protein